MKRFIATLSAGLVAVTLASGAWAAGESPVTPAQIEAAKTPADFEAIAKGYDQEAARLDAMAAEHEQMAKAYQAMAVGKKGGNPSQMAAHCKRLVDKYKSAAEVNREMAAAQRQMAKECCTKQ